MTALDVLTVPLDAAGRPLPAVSRDGLTWSPLVMTDSGRCRCCRRPVRVGESAYECPAVFAGFVCVECTG